MDTLRFYDNIGDNIQAPFIELAAEHGLSSPDTADKTYRRALGKMRQKLSK